MHTQAKASLGLNWINRFAQLGENFFTRLRPTPLPDVHWVSYNHGLALEMGLPPDWINRPGVLEGLSGCAQIAGSDTLASVYSGHQFGHWAGQLGDGRAIYLGEAQTDLGNLEIQLKGAGLTPYSRSGDGRAVLRSSIREYLCSEAMHALGIPTTRALCLTGSRGIVYREEVERAAVVTRVSPSFIRFGHFEHFAAKGDTASLRTLADFVITHYTHLLEESEELEAFENEALRTQITQNPYALMLYRVTRKTAKLMALWQSVGFCHGVMNTDNMSILGLTLDYGPFQFMDAFVPDHICNHTDQGGRYAYDQQPNVAYWNLYCLGQALLPLIGDKDLSVECLDIYKVLYPSFKQEIVLRKLGLSKLHSIPTDVAQELIGKLEKVMSLQEVDFTIFWRTLSTALSHFSEKNPGTNTLTTHSAEFKEINALFSNTRAQSAWHEWFAEYLKLISSGSEDLAEISGMMLDANPKFVLRNHLGEAAIKSAQRGDFSEVQILLKILSTPFDEHPEFQSYADTPPDWASSITISCSS